LNKNFNSGNLKNFEKKLRLTKYWLADDQNLSGWGMTKVIEKSQVI
jgi:hypothetical protein